MKRRLRLAAAATIATVACAVAVLAPVVWGLPTLVGGTVIAALIAGEDL